jgi:hypothetical protein
MAPEIALLLFYPEAKPSGDHIPPGGGVSSTEPS